MKEFSANAGNLEVVSASFSKALYEITDAGGTAKIRLTNSGRSLPQNALLHRWCNELSKHLTSGGRDYCTFEWVKLALKATFLGSEVITSTNLLTGEKTTTEEIRHSSDLDKGEMCSFLNQIQCWALDVNYILTAPISSEYHRLNEMQNN